MHATVRRKRTERLASFNYKCHAIAECQVDLGNAFPLNPSPL